MVAMLKLAACFSLLIGLKVKNIGVRFSVLGQGNKNKGKCMNSELNSNGTEFLYLRYKHIEGGCR